MNTLHKDPNIHGEGIEDEATMQEQDNTINSAKMAYNGRACCCAEPQPIEKQM